MIRRMSRSLIGMAVVASLLALAFAAHGAVQGLPEAPPPTDEVFSSEVADVVDAQLRFGLALYHALASRSGDESVFISPASVYTALGMAINGARGETEAEMAQALFASSVRREQLNAAMRALNTSLLGDGSKGIRVDIANGLWYRQDLDFNPAYFARVEEFYDAEIDGLDFGDPTSPGVVNEWVSDRTQGLIRDLIDRFDADTAMLLVNAVYFKGAWSDPFNPHLTRVLPFHLPSGRVKEVPMMYKSGRIDHYQGEGFQAIRLPYGEDGQMAMYVFLPDEGSSLDAFHERLTAERWTEWMGGFRSKQGQVLLPRIDLEYQASLNAVLQALGMRTAFQPGVADFGGMLRSVSSKDLHISEVQHRTVLKVDEEGTEAAGVTSIEFRLTSVPVYEFHFQADRPFFLAIRDEATGALLFAGSIADPGTEAGV